MIAHEGGIRWAANAPSAELLAAALQDRVPALRREPVPFGLLRALEEGDAPLRHVWRLWTAESPPVLFKHYQQQVQYQVELTNLRFYNAVAREFTPRLLACDDHAAALLVEDSAGTSAADAATLGSDAARIHLWERILRALAGIHSRTARQSALLRRLSAPHRPEIMALPREDLLEAAGETLAGMGLQVPLPAAERRVLHSAGTWLRTLLAANIARSSAPMLGLRSAHQIVVSAQRVHFVDLLSAPLGVREADLFPSLSCPERRTVIEHSYLSELARRGTAFDRDVFWRLDAAVVAIGCATRLQRLEGVQTTPHSIPEAARLLVSAIRDTTKELPELAEAAGVLARRAEIPDLP